MTEFEAAIRNRKGQPHARAFDPASLNIAERSLARWTLLIRLFCVGTAVLFVLSL